MKTDDILQRYMDLPKFMYLLQNSSLFLPKMSIFDDHLEGGLTAKNYLSSSNDGAILDVALNCFAPATNETSEERSKRLELGETVSKEIKQRIFETPFGLYKRDDLDELFPRCREFIYVSCWHKSSHECSAMWSLYGGDNNSVCIFTTEEKLRTQTADNGNKLNEIKLEDVKYIDHKSDTLSCNKLEPFLAKSLPFSFEKEARLIAYDPTLNLNSAVINEANGIKLTIRSLPELIDKVVISPKADAWFADSVKQLCDSKGINVVTKSTLRIERVVSFFSALEQLQETGL
jgi:hypothetical protein